MVPTLKYAFSIDIWFPPGDRIRFGSATQGQRGFVAIAGGSVSGPRLTGEVVAGSGGDWPCFREDGTVEFDARYLLRADDGTVIDMRNHGFAYSLSGGLRHAEQGYEPNPDDNYFRLTPVFETAPGPHDWLTRTVIVGVGEKHRDHTNFKYYEVT